MYDNLHSITEILEYIAFGWNPEYQNKTVREWNDNYRKKHKKLYLSKIEQAKEILKEKIKSKKVTLYNIKVSNTPQRTVKGVIAKGAFKRIGNANIKSVIHIPEDCDFEIIGQNIFLYEKKQKVKEIVDIKIASTELKRENKALEKDEESIFEITDEDKTKFNVKEASIYLKNHGINFSVNTLNQYRSKGIGPDIVKLKTRQVIYKKEDLDIWIKKQIAYEQRNGIQSYN